MLNRLFLSTLFCLISIFPCLSLDLKDGQNFVFLGDSITHKGQYTQYIETFFITRYPDLQINFHNAGISGDKAMDCLNRFDEDVAIHSPDYISIMLGMNDGGYKDFSQEIFGIYKNDMATLLKRIQEINSKAIVMTPTIFDQQQYKTQSQDPDFRFNRLQASTHYNSTMAFFGAWMREEAMKNKLDFVNLWGPLNDHTVTQRKTSPSFTFCEDSIHPEPPGHAIMAFSFLNDLKPDRKRVSAIQATFNQSKWSIKVQNAKVSNISGDLENLSFDMLSNSLPWVLPEEASLGYKLTKAGHKLSQEVLTVSGLAPGKYTLKIDGKTIGTPIKHTNLEKKIELQNFLETPQSQQALKVAQLVKNNFETSIVAYRGLQAKMKGQRRKHGVDSPEITKFREKIQPQLDELAKNISSQRQEIYKKAQPVSHRFTLSKN